MTFTPLKGMTDVVKRFLIEKPEGSHVTTMTIEDAEHYTPEQRAGRSSPLPGARARGPRQGHSDAGLWPDLPGPEESIAYDAFDMPRHWPRIGGMDFGWDHPFAAAAGLGPRHRHVYVTKAYRKREATPVLHAAADEALGRWLPVGLAARRPAARQGRWGEPWPSSTASRAEHAAGQHPRNSRTRHGGNGVEAGLMDCSTACRPAAEGGRAPATTGGRSSACTTARTARSSRKTTT
jgi:hypothetical protein